MPLIIAEIVELTTPPPGCHEEGNSWKSKMNEEYTRRLTTVKAVKEKLLSVLGTNDNFAGQNSSPQRHCAPLFTSTNSTYKSLKHAVTMTTVKPPPWMFSTATNPIQLSTITTYTLLELLSSTCYSISSAHNVIPKINANFAFIQDQIRQLTEPLSCFPCTASPPHTKPRLGKITDNEWAEFEAALLASAKVSFHVGTSSARDFPQDPHPHSSFHLYFHPTRLHCCPYPDTNPVPTATMSSTNCMPSKLHLHSPTCDAPPPKIPNVKSHYRMKASGRTCHHLKISHKPTPAIHIFPKCTSHPMVPPHMVVPSLSPHIHETGTPIMITATIPDQSTPLMSLPSQPSFSTPSPCSSLVSIHSPESFSPGFICMRRTLLLYNQKKFHGKYLHHYQDDGSQYLQLQPPPYQEVFTH